MRLDAIPVDLSELAALSAYQRRALALRCLAALGALALVDDAGPEGDRLIGVDEAAAILGMSASTLRHRGKRHPAFVDNGTRKQAYSVKRIQRMIASR